MAFNFVTFGAEYAALFLSFDCSSVSRGFNRVKIPWNLIIPNADEFSARAKKDRPESMTNSIPGDFITGPLQRGGRLLS